MQSAFTTVESLWAIMITVLPFVFQNSRLIKGSILDNVKLGRPEATEEEVLAALRAAQCMDIIEKFPDGVHTVIGTKGVYLSGGEQQRIAIARAMLKNAPVLILDEATAFADPDNEAKVQAAFQEYIETIRDLKASNAEGAYLRGLSEKIRAVEKQTMSAELTNAVFVTSAGMVLKLGIASVALTGSVLLINGSIDVLTLFMFLLVASRLYDPMQGALNNLAAVIAMRTNVARMNEILEYPTQTGSDELTNQGCDIVFDHVGFAYNSGETVLRDVSFTAKQGEVTALVGPSGGGKTTVSRLAARFWDHEKGSITVGGMDISKVDSEKLMGLYSIVFQDVTLFDNSILENIVRTRPMRKCLKRRDSRTVTSLPRSCPTAGTPTSARTAARSPAASVSAFLLRARF